MALVIVWLGLALVVAIPAIVWLMQNSGDPNPPPPPKAPLTPRQARRAELLEARQRLERQIEILERPVAIGRDVAPPDTRREMQELKEVLAGINRELEE